MTGGDTFPGKVIGRAEESEGEPAPTVDAQAVAEPDEETAFAIPPEAQSTMPLPSDPPTIFLGGLFILAALAALYAASEIILPIVLAFVLKLLLQPAMRREWTCPNAKDNLWPNAVLR